MNPKVSIITVVFNDEKHIARTVKSVLGQIYSPVEYIVVDGGSTDGTMEVIRGFKDIDRVISEKDKGVYDAMNKGFRAATGEYVWFMNSGDEIASPGTLEDLFRNMNGKPDVIYGGTVMTDEHGNEIGARRLKVPENLTWKSFRKGMVVCHQSLIVKRELAPEYNLEYLIAADIDWAIGCTKQASNLHHTGMVLSKFMEGGLSGRNLKRGNQERFRIMSRYYGFFPTLLRHFLFALRLTTFFIRHRRI